jgi:hypothetical protein
MASAKIGIGYNEEFQICFFGSCSPVEKFITLPHHFTGLFGRRRSLFEIGLGGTIISGSDFRYLVYPIVGYRASPLKKNKLSFRLFSHLPRRAREDEDILFVPFGFSFGVSF